MGETVDSIRRQNLRALVAKAGSQAEFARQIGRSDAQVSHIAGKSEHRAIGDSLARHVESTLGLEKGWMDVPHGVVALHEGEPPPYGMTFIKESRVTFAAGTGRIEYELVEDSEPAGYRDTFLQSKGMTPRRARRFKVSGDSMEPTLHDGDTVLVDLNDTMIVNGKVYAIRYGDELRVKRLNRRMDGSIALISDNRARYEPDYVPANAPPEQFAVIGRVKDRSGSGGL